MKILIKNGRIIDPANNIDAVGDLFIEKGKIIRAGGVIKETADKTIDASGKIVAPGFIDMHAHLREPGKEEAETIKTGLKAAAAGGFTSVCAMPNTDPPCDSQAHVKLLLEKAAECGAANILPIGTITRKREGKKISEMKELKEAGCRAVSDDGSSVDDGNLMRRALEYASMVDILVISHCEDKRLAAEGVMREGYTATVLGLKGVPSLAESTIVARDIKLAEEAGARLHIAHISSAESAELVRQAKKRGAKITAEVTPHHIALSDEDIRGYNTNMKVNPPLASKEDITALKAALKDGTIDVIATDHAPHTANEKEKEFDYAPFGMIGFETALSVAVIELIEKENFTWSEVLKKLTVNPANILRYERGALTKGSTADVVVIDPEEEWVYTKDMIMSKSGNSPFLGRRMKARVKTVVISGKIMIGEK